MYSNEEKTEVQSRPTNPTLISRIQDLKKLPENNNCSDCKSKYVTHVSCSIGIFLCAQCAKFHEQLKPGLNRVMPITSNDFTELDIKLIQDIGNKISNSTYERKMPPCYRRPTYNDPIVMMEQWICAKYERKEFMEGMPLPDYLARTKEGYLWKRGKDNKQFKIRKFILCKQTKTLKYFTKEGANIPPKAELSLDTIDAFIVPEKIGHSNGMQIVYESKGFTRSLYVYSETSEELISWYASIYAAKLQWQQIAFPCTRVEELCLDLWPQIVKEGWLMKCGPRRNDNFYKRWVCLVNRKLLYYLDSLDAFPKGEVFIGSKHSGCYEVTIEESTEGDSCKVLPRNDSAFSLDGGFMFFVRTPQRLFTFQAESAESRKEWVDALLAVIEKPLTPFEQS
ncbi:hypothetical protein HELRODRAFT_75990 [Helobdella robusta]|uniref:ArfGAP with dual PH domains 2 n=1 Tax=Helobdella robusta TaxID=6412 RepID=T1G2D6_HELRO|nr:hypothetical protein HELRODRAFT_75990 [Helobdella robusta]ESO07527.1 hypothetical protein HELRODRAFT_75990 [Helobdella robusta]